MSPPELGEGGGRGRRARRASPGPEGGDRSPPPPPGSCEESLRYVYEYLDGELDSATSARIDEHLRTCRRCYPHFNFERLFLDYLREKGLQARHAEELMRKVRERLRALE
ncbi:MAG: zf-HC2 domain-containing protein [Gemmatimonadota bacterium]